MLNRFFAGPVLLSSCCMLMMTGCSQAVGDPVSDSDEALVLHEWGTFTELQNFAGVSLGGINTDDEPVPKFVHGFARSVLASTGTRRASKRIAFRHSQVTMRLETPVIYFYPQQSAGDLGPLDVHVRFPDGWLSEFYPNAEYTAPGLKRMRLNRGTTGELAWNGLRLDDAARGPETDEPVWVIPRQTDATGVITPQGEGERFLFYRGVGNFTGPLRVKTDQRSDQLALSYEGSTTPSVIQQAWLVDVRRDGPLAFRTLGQLQSNPGVEEPLAVVPRSFEKSEYSKGNFALLQASMHRELVSAGLYDKEATAMLGTWEEAYFKSPGLRVFYVVPRQWTDERLPLTVNVPTKMERVMMGRVELLTDWQQQRVDQIAQGPLSDPKWIDTIPQSPARDKLFAGHSDFGELGVKIPEDYQAYMDLGRFRNAIIRAAAATRPQTLLPQFVKQHRLQSPTLPGAAAKQDSKVALSVAPADQS